MTTEAWIFLSIALLASVLLVIALGGDAQLAAENRRLRRALADALHPSRRPTIPTHSGSRLAAEELAIRERRGD